ncbi:hypothetical protein IE53DRAFT_389791 [Violaceomyces palustris]|uniref:Uncharacterized protein n=1 Tax=Violaceomyces palustris TaxID=1673888 RepID=A0ACD0NQF8_9BASI|nr:hypothetical protein IE53DRAFT_389791 [Violaceomyces palustris]
MGRRARRAIRSELRRRKRWRAHATGPARSDANSLFPNSFLLPSPHGLPLKSSSHHTILLLLFRFSPICGGRE